MRARRAAWTLGSAALALVAVAAALIWLRRDPATSGTDPSGSELPSVAASATGVAAPSAPPSASATLEASPGPASAASWQLTDTFGDGEEQPTFVFDATAWDDGFAAIGIRLDGYASDVGPYVGRPLLWTSADGQTWEERVLDTPAAEEALSDSRIEHVVTLPDGRLLAVSEHRRPNAWTSEDAETWTAVDLGIGDASVLSIAAGGGGLVLLANAADRAQQAWFSGDGMAWELTHAVAAEGEAQLEAVAAGPEGFVIVGALRGETDRPHVIASADGRSWVTAPDQPAFEDGDFPSDVAPLGPDWVATGFGASEGEQRSIVWRSADGLTWSRDLGPADPGGRNTYYATDIAGAGGHVILSPAEVCLCGPFQDPTVAWDTTDGTTWTAIDPDGSYVTEVVAAGDVVVAVGRIGRGESAALWRWTAP